MSATNRGAQRRAFDWYGTPAWPVRRLLEAVVLPDGDWLEPAVGDGAIVRAVNSCPNIELGRVTWTTLDIRPEAKAHVIGDFLTHDFGQRRFSVAITNPPYSLAFDFAKKCMGLANVTVLLLRLNWLEGNEKVGSKDWIRDNMPDVYVLPNRPTFTGGGNDACAYAWMIWRAKHLRAEPGAVVRQGRIRVLDKTSKEERRAA